MKDALVPIDEAAERLGASKDAIRKRIQRGKQIPRPCTSTPPWLWKQSDIDRYIATLAPGSDTDRARHR